MEPLLGFVRYFFIVLAYVNNNMLMSEGGPCWMELELKPERDRR
jgi:hypothetical protein